MVGTVVVVFGSASPVSRDVSRGESLLNIEGKVRGTMCWEWEILTRFGCLKVPGCCSCCVACLPQ